MLRLLTTVSWRHVKRHRLRTALTFFGIALGVAVIVAIAAVNRSLTTSFQSTIDQIAGKAVLQVANGESGIAESLFPLIRDTAGVRDASAAVEGFSPVAGVPGERLYVYGVDLLTDFAIRDHQFVDAQFGFDQALDFIAQPDSIALTESFSRRLKLPVGARVTLLTSQGKREFTVRALLKEQGTAKVFGGSFALMDLPVAQKAFGKEGKLDIVDLTIEEGEKIEAVQQRLRERLKGAAEVERPRKRGEQIELLLTSFRVGLFFVSLIALFVGFFLIYNTVSVSVIQRKKEIGVLRCVGMKRSELLRLILTEALLLALGGSVRRCGSRLASFSRRVGRRRRNRGQFVFADRSRRGKLYAARVGARPRQRRCGGAFGGAAAGVGGDARKPPGKRATSGVATGRQATNFLGQPSRALLHGAISHAFGDRAVGRWFGRTIQRRRHRHADLSPRPGRLLPGNYQFRRGLVLAV